MTDALQPQNAPGTVDAEAGQVLLDGPDGVAVTMTPDAAEETGRRLIAAAAAARGHDQKAAADDGGGEANEAV